MFTPSGGGSEKRRAERYFVRWKMAIVFDDQESKPTYHGRTHDLSMGGTAMLAGFNLLASSPVTILLAPPPLHVNERPRVIEIKARQLDVVYAGVTRCFRLGFSFLEFKNNGKDLLTARLRHHQSVARMSSAKTLS